MRKKMLSLALSLVMVLSLVPSAFAAEAVNAADKFTDVPSDAWYLDELNYAVNNGYISGTSATQFSPDGILTRAQFVTILGRMMGVSSSASGVTRFTDVPSNSWYAPYVAWAAAEGYVNGTSQTTFAPESKLTVEQLGTVLANYLNKTGKVPSGRTSVYYTDVFYVSGWALANMELMMQYDLLVTDKNGQVFPQKQVTRAEAVVSLVRLARGIGMGTEPVTVTKPVVVVEPQKYVSTKRTDIVKSTDTEYEAAQRIHDALWQFGEINSSMTEKEKAIAYFKWMWLNTDYDDNAVEDRRLNGDFDSIAMAHYAGTVFKTGLGVCDGLSKAYLCLLETEGISCRLGFKSGATWQTSHAWAIAVLDGVEYDPIELSDICSNVDGSFNQHVFDQYVMKYFYPEEWAKQFDGSGFGGPLSEEELRQMLEDMQNEYNASWGQ